ncbi:hypothetical protein GA830_01685 [Mesorhizobium sp. NBSH29]|nr:hypothetical protein GA830_01685 [Mesorhizobium sp. NBSH29]
MKKYKFIAAISFIAASIMFPVHIASASEKPIASTTNRLPGPAFSEQKDGTYICPNSKVMVGRRHDGDEHDGKTIITCGDVMVNGEKAGLVDLGWSPLWNSEEDTDGCEYPSARECNHSYICPDRSVMTGTKRGGDENSHMQYRCAQVVGAASVDVINGWSSGLIEIDHRISCSYNAVMIGRKHKGDENGITNYACGYLFVGGSESSSSISFRQHDTGQPCALNVPDDQTGGIWTYFLSEVKMRQDEIAPCSGNTADSMEMLGVPSATKILLTDDDLCQKKNGDFWIELQTTRKATTFDVVKLLDVIATPKGQIVSGAKGLKLVDYFHRVGSEMTRALSCVKISNSSTTPYY